MSPKKLNYHRDLTRPTHLIMFITALLSMGAEGSMPGPAVLLPLGLLLLAVQLSTQFCGKNFRVVYGSLVI